MMISLLQRIISAACYPCDLDHFPYQAAIDSVVLMIARKDMGKFSYSNPGVFMSIHDLMFVC